MKAAVLKYLSDRVNVEFRKAKEDLARELGPEGRKNAVWAGNKVASVTVSKGGRVTVTSEPRLVDWVCEHYPTEAEEVVRVRPAFLEQIKKSSEAAGEPCGPGGELDIPGISVGEPYPMVRTATGGADLLDQLWREGRITIEGTWRALDGDPGSGTG